MDNNKLKVFLEENPNGTELDFNNLPSRYASLRLTSTELSDIIGSAPLVGLILTEIQEGLETISANKNFYNVIPALENIASALGASGKGAEVIMSPLKNALKRLEGDGVNIEGQAGLDFGSNSFRTMVSMASSIPTPDNDGSLLFPVLASSSATILGLATDLHDGDATEQDVATIKSEIETAKAQAAESKRQEELLEEFFAKHNPAYQAAIEALQQENSTLQDGIVAFDIQWGE